LGPHLERERGRVQAAVGGCLDVLAGAVETDRRGGIVEQRARLTESRTVGIRAVVRCELVGSYGAIGLAKSPVARRTICHYRAAIRRGRGWRRGLGRDRPRSIADEVVVDVCGCLLDAWTHIAGAHQTPGPRLAAGGEHPGTTQRL